jgi:hypothetical protein
MTVGKLEEYVPGQLWLVEYPIRYGGTRFNARTTVLRLADRSLLIHSPCPMDTPLHDEIAKLGSVAHIVAPGNFHHFHVPACQRAFPEAATWICPGVERKRPDLHFDWMLGDRPPEQWQGALDQVLIRGNRLMTEVAFYHRLSRTLLLVDVIENFTDQTAGTNWVLKVMFKVLGMWNRPLPAPEYRMAWSDKAAARACLKRILEWDFERIIIAHGDLIEQDAKNVARLAWRRLLEG